MTTTFATSAASLAILPESVRVVARVVTPLPVAQMTDTIIEMARDVRVVVVVVVLQRDAFAATRVVTLLEIVARLKNDAIDAIKRVIMPKSVRMMWRVVRVIIVESLVICSVIVPMSHRRRPSTTKCAIDAISQVIWQEIAIITWI